MLKRVLLVVFVFVLFLVLIIPARAQGDVDAQLDTFLDTMSDVQMAHMGKYGRFFQTYVIAPEVGSVRATPGDETAVSVLVRPPCPHDSWGCPAIDLDLELRTITLRVNVYESPSGWGYEVVAEYTDARGQLWRRVENRGPETWRAQPWVAVLPPEVEK